MHKLALIIIMWLTWFLPAQSQEIRGYELLLFAPNTDWEKSDNRLALAQTLTAQCRNFGTRIPELRTKERAWLANARESGSDEYVQTAAFAKSFYKDVMTVCGSKQRQLDEAIRYQDTRTEVALWLDIAAVFVRMSAHEEAYRALISDNIRLTASDLDLVQYTTETAIAILQDILQPVLLPDQSLLNMSPDDLSRLKLSRPALPSPPQSSPAQSSLPQSGLPQPKQGLIKPPAIPGSGSGSASGPGTNFTLSPPVTDELQLLRIDRQRTDPVFLDQ